MKTRLLFAALAFLLAPDLRAINVSEPPDFPNSPGAVTPSFTYTLSTGSNTFSGQVAVGGQDTGDFFAVVIPAGLRISAVQVAGDSAPSFTVPTTPAGPGTYTCGINPGQIISNVNWTITFTVVAIPDYDVTTASGVMTVTNNTNHADTLTVSQQIVNNVTDISFSASGRTFSLNGGANNNGGTLVSLSSITAITINGGSGGETFSVGGFSSTSFPSLTIVGGAGNDTVNFTGNITFASGNNLTVNLQSGGSPGVDTITVSNGAQLVASGNGAITMLCSKNVSLSNGAVLQSVDGSIDVEANQQTPATTGNFTGVNLDGSGTKIQKTGMNLITVKGVGGNDPGGNQLGVGVFNGAQIVVSTDGSYAGINVTGVGGASAGPINRGVTVYGSGSGIITSGGAAQTVNGTGGASSSAYGIGVSVLYGGQITGLIGGVYSGAMTVTGVGAGAPGGYSNQGVEVAETGSQIAHSDELSVIATSGPGSSVGLDVYDSASITSSYGAVSISADSIAVDNTASISAVGWPVGFSPAGMATQVDLGGAAGFSNALVITNAELARFSAPYFDFSSPGDLTISAPLSLPSGTNVYLAPSGAIHATANGADVSVGTGAVNLGDGFFVIPTFDCPITGASADTGYPQLNVAGNINLNSASLSLAGTTFAGAVGNQFTIVKNSGSGTTTSGTFTNLPEGAYLVWPGSNTLAAQISYVGGTGHDVVLTLVPVAQALTVNNTNNDTSVGSLQSVIAFAAANPGADTITFNPSLSGQTITLTQVINISDSAGVTIDASSLPGGLTINGAGPSGSFGLFNVNAGNSLTLRGLTLANGGGNAYDIAGGYGGAIQSKGTVTLVDCTLTGNSAAAAGAILNGGAGTLTLTQCTLAGNNGDSNGGAIYNTGTLTMTQCTVSGNNAFTGGAIINYGAVTLVNSIVSGNTANSGADIFNSSGVITLVGTNIVQSLAGNPATGSGTIINAAPALVSLLGNYGGPTQTLPPLPGSPAIDHGDNTQIPNDPATGLPFTTDQRGFTRKSNSTVDIGAVETSAFQVTTNLDDGSAGSLRQRVVQASDTTTTITFAPGVASPIQLASGEIVLAKNLAIDATSLGGMTISGGGSSRIFTASSPSTIVLTGLTLTGGNGGGSLSSGSAGAIYNNAAILTLNQCTLISNGATGVGSGNSGIGGAIRNAAAMTGSLTLNRCTVANNTANTVSGSNVGGVACATIPTTVNQCTFSGNSTTGIGGALSVALGGSLGVNQSTIAGNQAANGGGINNGGTTTLTNTIVATNTASTGADINNSGGTFTRVGRNVVGDNNTVATQFPVGSPNANGDYVGTTASPVNPLLAPLGSYGGPTLTMALLMGTPAHNAAVNSTFTTDQRGFAITDGHPDIGAYEAGDISNFNAWIYENLPASTANNAADHATTFDYDGDGVTNFNEWIALTNPGDPTSYLHITQITHSGNNVSITFTSVLGRHYSVEESSDLAVWSFVEGAISGTGNTITRSYVLAGGPPKLFFHVLPGP